MQITNVYVDLQCKPFNCEQILDSFVSAACYCIATYDVWAPYVPFLPHTFPFRIAYKDQQQRDSQDGINIIEERLQWTEKKVAL